LLIYPLNKIRINQVDTSELYNLHNLQNQLILQNLTTRPDVCNDTHDAKIRSVPVNEDSSEISPELSSQNAGLYIKIVKKIPPISFNLFLEYSRVKKNELLISYLMKGEFQ
jgi:hypothetical protein